MSAYTGPERRWMKRSLYDWTWRSEQHDNRFARGEAQSVAILEALRTEALKHGRGAEADAIWDGMYEIREKLHRRRARIAKDVAPWFTAGVFAESHEANCPRPRDEEPT